MRNWLFGVGAILLLSIHPAYAGFQTGNDLLRWCTNTDNFSEGECGGYIIGVADAQEFFRAANKSASCVPADVEAGQLRDVVVKYLQDNPNVRNLGASVLVMAAIVNAWPCPT